MTTKEILATLEKNIVGGVGSAIAKDIYQEIKKFILSRPDYDKQLLVMDISYNKPPTFIAFELARISSQTSSYLLNLPVSERCKLIERARQGTTGDNEEMLFNLIRIVHNQTAA
jgi:hypothetical protein